MPRYDESPRGTTIKLIVNSVSVLSAFCVNRPGSLMFPYLPTILLALSIIALIGSVASFVYDYRQRSSASLLRRLREDTELDRVDDDDYLFRRMFSKEGERTCSWRESLQVMIEHSGFHWSLSRLCWISVAIGSVFGFMVYVLTSSEIGALVAGAAGLIVPIGIVRKRYASRQHRLLNQLPETFELIVRSVKAGQSVHASIQMIASENRPPISTEFKRCSDQQNLGLPPDEAFRDLAHRNGVMELQIFAVAMLVQRQTGGSLVEILTNLSKLVRSRLRMQARLRALTGEARMQAVVLTLLPIVALFAIHILKPDYVAVLYSRPQLILGMAVSNVVGACWIRKLIQIDY